jgi:hypothetical protein
MTRTTEKPGSAQHMIGDRMAGSEDEISSELPNWVRRVFRRTAAEEPARRKSERP